jgi:hypothetical protein
MKQEKCKACGQFPKINCNWKQGRCPHLPPLVGSIFGAKYKTIFQNLLNFFKGKHK